MIETRVGLLFFLSIVSTILAFFRPATDDRSYQASLIAITALAAIIFFSHSNRKTRSIGISISFLFFVSYAIISYNIPLLRLLGFDIIDSWAHARSWSNKDIYNLVVTVPSVGVVWFFLAASMSEPSTHQIMVRPLKCIYVSEIIPLIAAFSLVIFLSFSGTLIYGDYSAINRFNETRTASDGWSYFYQAFRISFTAYAIIKVVNYYALKDQIRSIHAYLAFLGRPFLLLYGIFFVVMLQAGYRAPIIYFSLLTFGPYIAVRTKIGVIGSLSIIFVGAYVMSFLALFRQSYSNEFGAIDRFSNQVLLISNSEGRYFSWFRQEIPLSQFLEMATEIRALSHIIANVPSSFDFGFGFFSMIRMSSIIPFLRSTINEVFFDGDWTMDGSTKFLTYIISGSNPTFSHSITLTSELYLDFGIAGVIVGLFLFGLFVGRHEYKIAKGVDGLSFAGVCVLIFFAHSISIPRSSIVATLPDIIHVYVLLRLATRKIPIEATHFTRRVGVAS